MTRVQIDWLGGYCPVQAEGTIDGHPFYFRARGSAWALQVGGADPVIAPAFVYREDWPGGPFDAGWMSEDDAMRMIEKGAQKFRNDRAVDRRRGDPVHGVSLSRRPAAYIPARRFVPWWWQWGGIWRDGERYATWPQARAIRRRAKKKGPSR